jgi:peptide-methionine (S)-S-oxide reductase
VAEETIRDVDSSGHWPGKTVTRITEAGRFWANGPEDQDYFLRYPDYPDGSKPPFAASLKAGGVDPPSNKEDTG